MRLRIQMIVLALTAGAIGWAVWAVAFGRPPISTTAADSQLLGDFKSATAVAKIAAEGRQAAEFRSVMQADVAQLVTQASELRRLWPWQPAIPEVSRVVRHGKPVAHMLVGFLADDPDELAPEAPDLAVQQQAAITLCRIFEVPEECGRIYCNRAAADVNRGVKKFWISKVSQAGQR